MENIFKNIIRFSIIGIIIILLYFLFRSPDQNEKLNKKKNGSGGELSLLLGGGLSGNDPSADESLFESDFYKSGKIEYDESLANSSDDSRNPINPQTGKPYTDAVMNQFSSLREKFPGNALIPKKMSNEEEQEKQDLNRLISLASKSVYAKTATTDEIKLHYDHKLKQSQDRKEIIDYLLSSQAEDSESLKKVNKVNAMIQKQYEQAKTERNKAFAEAGIPVEEDSGK